MSLTYRKEFIRSFKIRIINLSFICILRSLWNNFWYIIKTKLLSIGTRFPQTVTHTGGVILVAQRNGHIRPACLGNRALKPCFIACSLTFLSMHTFKSIECYKFFIIVVNRVHLNILRFHPIIKPILDFAWFHPMFGLISIFLICIRPGVVGWWFVDDILLCRFVEVVFLHLFDFNFLGILDLLVFADQKLRLFANVVLHTGQFHFGFELTLPVALALHLFLDKWLLFVEIICQLFFLIF